MGQISSGIGLISGIDIRSLVDQLIAVEGRPKALVQQRSAVLTSQQVALQEVNAAMLALKSASGALTQNNTFRATTGSSSNEDVLAVTTSNSANPGAYSFTVARLVSSQQLITKGFADRTATAVAPSGGTLTFEAGEASLNPDTLLSRLNGGDGVTRGKIRITDRSGASSIVDLSRAVSVDDVLEAINSADNINVTASVKGDGLVITDNTGATAATLAVSEVSGGSTAASLGLNVASVADTLAGTAVNTVGNATLLTSLNDGNGVGVLPSQADFSITQRDGTVFTVDLAGSQTIGDVIDAVNAASTAAGGSVTASVNGDGTGLQLTDASAGATTFAVAAVNSSTAAADLGILASDGDADGVITGSRTIATLNSKLLRNLNGGAGVGLGTIRIDNRAGVQTDIDLSSAVSVDDVIRLINDSGAGVTASLNNARNGVSITDSTGSVASNLTISDVAGTAAADLKIAQDVADDAIESGNLQLRYISTSTRLAQLNGGAGVVKGQFTITDSNGASATVDLTQGNEVTIADVLAEINSRGLAINARVNDNGDGIIIEDTGSGVVKLKVEEAGSTTARGLGILGEAANPGDDLTGSFEKTVTIAATDTLDQMVQKINDAGLNISATVINDGSAGTPFRLSLNATKAGSAGAFVFDDGGLGLGASELSKARNAVAFYGAADPAKAIAITSTTNTLENVVPGATIDLKSTSASPVQVVISQNTGAITKAAKEFVDKFNAVITVINKHDKYDPETEQRGLLLGESSVARVRSALFSIVSARNGELSSQFRSLAQVGIKVGAGAKMELDETKFLASYAADPEAVRNLFTFKETETDDENVVTVKSAGVGVRIDELLKRLTDSEAGPVQSRIDAIDDQLELNRKRIEQIDKSLENKRERLTAEFIAMERALAEMQSQSSALASFQPLQIQAPRLGGVG